MSKRTIQDGEIFGKWTVIDFDKIKKKYKVQCECGNIRYYSKSDMKIHTGCFDCMQKVPRLYARLPDDLGLKRRIYKNYKNSSKKRGYEFELSEEYFFSLIFSNCAYCGSDLSMINNEQSFRGRSIKYNGIDRIDNSIGYTKENTVTCCKMCNCSKHTHDFDVWKCWVEKVYKKLFKES